MEIVSSNALNSIQPLVELLTIGSSAGTSASFLTNDSPGPGSATMISPPHYSKIDIEPGNYPYILNRQSEAQNQFHRQRQQYADCEKLKRQVLQQTGARQKLLFEWIFRKQVFDKRTAKPDSLEVDGHQPVKEEPANHIETA